MKNTIMENSGSNHKIFIEELAEEQAKNAIIKSMINVFEKISTERDIVSKYSPNDIEKLTNRQISLALS